MDQNTLLPWGQPWNIHFNEELSEADIKLVLSKIGQRLFVYVKDSLGGAEHFSLQINCSQSVDDELWYQIFANLVVKQEAVIKWKQLNEVDNKKIILNNPLEYAFEGGWGFAGMAGSKPPPPPPPPPPRAVEIMGDAPPFRYQSNWFIASHVIDFSRDGQLSQFNERPLADRGGEFV